MKVRKLAAMIERTSPQNAAVDDPPSLRVINTDTYATPVDAEKGDKGMTGARRGR
jgi:hypothetical protein